LHEWWKPYRFVYKLKTPPMKKLMIVLAGAAITVFASSCEKEKIKGCTVSKADNYNSSAEESDGSCKYTAYLNFYITPSTGSSLSSAGVSILKYYVNDTYIGFLTTNQTLSSMPNCEATTNVVKKTLTLTSSSESFVLKVIDEDGIVRINNQTFDDLNLKSDGMCNTYSF
jgi:hypothetical protein